MADWLGAVLKLNPLSENEEPGSDPQTPESHNHYADKVSPHFHTASHGIQQYIWGPQIDAYMIVRTHICKKQ